MKRYCDRGTIGRRPGSGRPSKITGAVMELVEAQMQNDETTAVQLYAILKNSGIDIINIMNK